MNARRRFLSLVTLGSLVFLTACGRADVAQGGARTIDDRFPIRVGARTVAMQVALLPAETQKGLMFRREMGADEGMVFVFDREQQMSFWMRNTSLPLDIGYFDPDGVLREIYPLHPHDERPVVSRGRMQFALEMNQGWYHRAGVKPGDKLDLTALAAAIRERGLKPADYGLR